jgi:hypothetical protein
MSPTTDPYELPDEPVVLNAPVVRLLMIGAGIRTDQELCAQVGINPSNFSRAMRPDDTGRRQQPSPQTMTKLMRRFPLCPPAVLFVPLSQVDDPARYGMTDRLVEDGPPPRSPQNA